MPGCDIDGVAEELDELNLPMTMTIVAGAAAEFLELAGPKIQPHEIAYRLRRCERVRVQRQ
jgi:hypothetical protein